MTETSSASPIRRSRRALRFTIAGLAIFVVLGVAVSQQFPSLTHGPKSSVEMLEGLFKAPFAMPADAAKFVFKRVKKDAVVLFIDSCELPADARGRLVAMVRGEEFASVTVPFVYYLYELYGEPAAGEPESMADLAYDEPAEEPHATSGPGLGQIVRQSPALRKHLRNALRLFDALFLQLKPGATWDDPVEERYDEAAYNNIKAIAREVAAEFLAKPGDADRAEQSEYLVMLEETLRDDAKLTDFIEFFADFVRQLADSWLESFARRENRKEERQAWVADKLAHNRRYEIADYARSQAERKLAMQLAVDGLQGKLLEGLCQLSSADRAGSGAHYVTDLVHEHQKPEWDPARYDSKMPPALGHDVVELVDKAPNRPDYLENFKKYFFAPDAPAVVVNVATVDTPSISVRNLPIIFSGHAVAGPNGTGIPNFSYLDRATGRGWYFWGSDVLHMRNIFGNREDLIPRGQKRDGPGARTLFERLWRHNTVSCMATIDTGALEKNSSEIGVAVSESRRNFIEKIIVARFRQRAKIERELNRRRRWLIDHRSTSGGFLARLILKPITLKTFREHAEFIAEHEDEGLPDYTLWYNPWPDHFAHTKGPYSDDIIGYAGEYDRLDFYVGKMIEVYESVPTVSGRGANYADRALFGVVSDHGLVYTPQIVSTDDLLFESMRRDGIDVKYLKITHDEGGLPAIHGRKNIKPTRPFDAVVGSTAGGSYIIDLFGSTATDGDDEAWRRHPDYHELRNYKLLSGQRIDWIEQLKLRLNDTMDVAVVRENGPAFGESWPSAKLPRGPTLTADAVVRVVSGRGEARVYRNRVIGEEAGPRTIYRYEKLTSEDPLTLVDSVRPFLVLATEHAPSYLPDLITTSGNADDAIWRSLLSNTLRPDVIYQFSHLYDTDRAGTINIFPLPHVGMNSGVPGRHAGEAFGEKNGTQLYRGAGLKRATIQTARNGSLPVTIFHWLVGDDGLRRTDPAVGGTAADQFGYPSLLDEPALRTDR